MNIKDIKERDFELIDLPDKCPFCHKSISPIPAFGNRREYESLDVFLICPNNNCNRSFVALYIQAVSGRDWEFYEYVTKGEFKMREFNETIKSLSPDFCIIYNQSSFAEQNGLTEICGVGYRKALEYLIKNYALFCFPNDKKEIEDCLLGKCINKFVADFRIKEVAKRAAWLGNDETHYLRKWESKNLEDLKKLIELTIHWIEMEELTKSFVEEMPG